MAINYYQVLNLPNNANKQQIRNAYIILAKQHHPDKNKESTQFTLINKAYTTLIDDDTKKKYDISLQSILPREIIMDLINDFVKFVKFIKPITNFDVITDINELYLGKVKEIQYENIKIIYYPIKDLEIEFEDEILKLNSLLIDNLNYVIDDYDLYMQIKLSQMYKSNKTYTYEIVLPDTKIINVNVNEDTLGDNRYYELCFRKCGLLKLDVYGINTCNEKVIKKRGNLFVVIKK